MFLKEALQRCSQLQNETASFYDALCSASDVADGRVGAWKGVAARERRRAGFLEALAALCTALEDEGPFLVQIPVQIGALSRALDSAAWRRATCSEHPRCACADFLATIQTAGLYADLLEVAEPELRRALRAISNEVRSSRRVETVSHLRAAPRVAVS